MDTHEHVRKVKWYLMKVKWMEVVWEVGKIDTTPSM